MSTTAFHKQWAKTQKSKKNVKVVRAAEYQATNSLMNIDRVTITSLLSECTIFWVPPCLHTAVLGTTKITQKHTPSITTISSIPTTWRRNVMTIDMVEIMMSSQPHAYVCFNQKLSDEGDDNKQWCTVLTHEEIIVNKIDPDQADDMRMQWSHMIKTWSDQIKCKIYIACSKANSVKLNLLRLTSISIVSQQLTYCDAPQWCRLRVQYTRRMTLKRIDVKNVFYVFYLCHVFYVFNVFYYNNVFYY